MANKNGGNECTVCGGTGWIVVEKDGREVATRCRCYQDGVEHRLIDASRIPKRYLGKDFDNFDAYTRELTAAKTFIGDFINSFPAVDKGLLLVGPPGTGKTHLATASLKEAIKKARIRGLFVDYREFIRSIQDSFNPTTASTQLEIIQPVLDADLLVMDELGALKPTEWVQDTITYILNNRYTNEKITILTTNYSIRPKGLEKKRKAFEDNITRSLEELKAKHSTDTYRKMEKWLLANYETAGDLDYPLEGRVGTRLVSRLFEMCQIIPFDGIPDYRKRTS